MSFGSFWCGVFSTASNRNFIVSSLQNLHQNHFHKCQNEHKSNQNGNKLFLFNNFRMNYIPICEENGIGKEWVERARHLLYPFYKWTCIHTNTIVPVACPQYILSRSNLTSQINSTSFSIAFSLLLPRKLASKENSLVYCLFDCLLQNCLLYSNVFDYFPSPVSPDFSFSTFNAQKMLDDGHGHPLSLIHSMYEQAIPFRPVARSHFPFIANRLL